MSYDCQRNERFIMEHGCPARASEIAKVTVPVEVRARSELKEVAIHCMGPAVITRNSDRAPGVPCAVSKFTVSQRLRVDIPLEFTAETDVGEGHVVYGLCEEEEPGVVPTADCRNDCRIDQEYQVLNRVR